MMSFLNNLSFAYKVARILPIPKSIYSRLRLNSEFEVWLDNGLKITIQGHNLSEEKRLFWEGIKGFGEPQSLRLWMALAKHSRVILDIGAYWGIYSLVAGAVNGDAHIYGFEPVEPAFQMYEQNCRLNHFDITPIKAAVGKISGETEIFYFPGNLPMSSLTRSVGTLSEKVRMVNLQDFVNENRISQIDLMKIDVETHEPDVISGMGESLLATYPTMIVEVLNNSVGQSLEHILGERYVYFHIDEERGPSRAPNIRRVSKYSRNYLFCSEAMANELKII